MNLKLKRERERAAFSNPLRKIFEKIFTESVYGTVMVTHSHWYPVPCSVSPCLPERPWAYLPWDTEWSWRGRGTMLSPLLIDVRTESNHDEKLIQIHSTRLVVG